MIRARITLPTGRPRAVALLIAFCYLILAIVSKLYSGPSHIFVNHYLGDLFIVGWLYFLVLWIFPKLKLAVAAALIFTISVFVEFAQVYLRPISSGLPKWVLFWTGTMFDPLDLAAYSAGVALAVVTDHLIWRGKKK
jgi:hypothetical protein